MEHCHYFQAGLIVSPHHWHIRHHPPSPQPALFPGPPGWVGARRELLDFMVQEKINRGRHTDHPAGRHSIRTNQCPPHHSHFFYRPDALPSTQPTVSKHGRQLAQLNPPHSFIQITWTVPTCDTLNKQQHISAPADDTTSGTTNK